VRKEEADKGAEQEEEGGGRERGRARVGRRRQTKGRVRGRRRRQTKGQR
jgi:hypothetical protein